MPHTRLYLTSLLCGMATLGGPALANADPPSLQGNTLLTTAQLTQPPAEAALLTPDAWATLIRERYRAAGFPAVQVRSFTDPQGQSRISVIEGRIARIRIIGNQHHDDANVLFPLKQLNLGQAPNTGPLLREIALSNENPSKQLGITLEALPSPGEIDARVDVSDRQVSHFSLSYDNDGSPLLGRDRVYLGYQNANLFNRDHVLTALLGSSTDHPERNRSGSLGYRLPLYGTAFSLDLLAAHSRSNTGPASSPEGKYALTGSGTTLGVRLVQQLPPLGEVKHKLLYGIDHKAFSNRCQSNDTALSADACGSVDSRPISLTYINRWTSDVHDSSMVLSYAHNLPGGERGDAQYHQLLNKTANWQVWRAQAVLDLPLRHAWKVRAQLSGQYSPDKLIVGEQFGIGGPTSVRGYQERSATGDRGTTASLELHMPLPPRSLLGLPLQSHALIFADYGQTRDNGQSSRHDLSSAGLGLRIHSGERIALRLDLGHVLRPLSSTAPGAPRQTGDAFLHIKASYHF